MPKEQTKKDSLVGRYDILRLEGHKTKGLDRPVPIALKGLSEFSIVVQSGVDASLFPNEKQQDRVRFENKNLVNRDFSEFSFKSALFRYCDLSGVKFNHAILKHCIFDNCILEGADFRYANLQNARLVDCQLFAANFDQSLLCQSVIESCSMGAQSFHEANCQGMKLNNSQVIHGFFDGADLSGAELRNTVLRDCTLSNTHFDHAVLNDCQFRGCESFQDGPVFSGSVLNNVALMDCKLQAPKLVNTTLRSCKMTRVSMESALLEGTLFQDVELEGGTLKDCFSLELGPVFEQCQLKKVLIDRAELVNARFIQSTFLKALIRHSEFSDWTMTHTSLDSDTLIE